MFKFLTRRSFSKILAVATTVMTVSVSPVVAKDPIRIAYLSPSFDISDAWEHVFWSLSINYSRFSYLLSRGLKIFLIFIFCFQREVL